MPAFIISRFKILDPDRMLEYSSRAVPMAQSYGGSYLVKSEAVEALDGSYDGRKLVIMHFPDLARFREFWNSPEYQELRKIRLEATEGDVWLIPSE